MDPECECPCTSCPPSRRNSCKLPKRGTGSMSRGEGSDNSDVDLLVTLAPGTSALALGGLLLDAQELLGRRVDVVTEASLHPALRERVVAGAVAL